LTDKSKLMEVRPHEEGSPSERLRRELDDVLRGITEQQDPIEAVARLGARLILQQALEDEVSEFVGRARHERAQSGEKVIYRNGFAEPSTVCTTSGRPARP
jgi:transposase-like protein